MKAISVKQPWASLIASGEKTIETRTWPTNYRGDLLIVSSKKPTGQGPTGVALAIVRLYECRLMQISDEDRAQCEWYPGAWAWMLDDIRPIAEPLPVRGNLGLYDVEVISG